MMEMHALWMMPVSGGPASVAPSIHAMTETSVPMTVATPAQGVSTATMQPLATMGIPAPTEIPVKMAGAGQHL